ncbi:MAG: ion channel [Halomonas sp.]|uniref:ion channel n=1 Tax=Halomonas sp. TaxID=1486246 RepID=UPI003F8F5E98
MFAIFSGILISLLNIAIHGLLTVFMVRTVHTSLKSTHHTRPTPRIIVTMVIAASILMGAHFVEIWLWGLAYALLGVTPDAGADFTFAFVNYTTLGYGDILPVEPWMVMGPMTAMNGVLLFGWSTAVLFQVLSITFDHYGFKY